MFYDRYEKLALIQWLDTKPVIFASNFTGIQPLSALQALVQKGEKTTRNREIKYCLVV